MTRHLFSFDPSWVYIAGLALVLVASCTFSPAPV